MKKIGSALLLLCLLFAGLTACGEKPAEVSSAAGVGRFTEVPGTETDAGTESGETESGEAEGSQAPGQQSQTGDTLSWKFENGKYTYTFPKRDDSGLAGVNEMYSFSRAMFEDQPDDWFFGKTTRDAATGEVTVVWDRQQSTLDVLEKYGAVYRGDEERKVVYLTFDAGYENGTTGQILDILKEKQVPAAFFVNGHYVNSAGDLIQRMLDEGHIIGNHAVNHYDLTTVDVDTFIAEVQGLDDLYYAKFPDAPPMVYFRPPSGNCNEWVLKMTDLMGYTTVLWSWAYQDYDTNNQPPVSSTLEKVKAGLHNGCVYLLHPESQTNVDMLGQMIDWIRGQGYEFLPIADIQ